MTTQGRTTRLTVSLVSQVIKHRLDPVDYRPAKIEALIADDSLIAVFTSYIGVVPLSPHDNQHPNAPVSPWPIVGRAQFSQNF